MENENKVLCGFKGKVFYWEELYYLMMGTENGTGNELL